MKSLAKEIFIIALLLMIVVFMIGMIFYEYMPNNKTVPEPIAYVSDSSTTAILQQISAESADTETGKTETQSVIKSYSIGSKELSTAASKQSYTSGKTNPFAEYTDPISTNTVDGNTTTNQNTNNSNNNNNNNKQDSTGTFFENKTSK